MIAVRVLRESNDLEAIAPRWRALLERATHAQAVLTPMWMLAWWRVFGEGRSLRVLAIEDGQTLVGLVPLSSRRATHRPAIPVRRLELLATGEREEDEIASEYVGAIVARGREADVAGAVARCLRDEACGPWDELSMTAMNGEDAWLRAFAAALAEQGIASESLPIGSCPYAPLPATWDAYLHALGSSQRYLVTRSLRDVDRWTGGRWELRRACCAADLDQGRAVLHRLHGERWRAAGRAGVFASDRFARFHDDVMPRMLAGEDGASLELTWLVANGRPVAASYCIVYAGRVCFYQGGRALDVPKGVRPGIAMHALSIRAAIEAGRREYDFLAGESRYKRDLALAARPLVALRAICPSVRGRAVEAVRAMAERAIAKLRRPERAAVPQDADAAR